MARILILIGAHLCTAPRPLKEAEALSLAGHEVTVGGCWLDSQKADDDEVLTRNRKWRFQTIIDLRSACRPWKRLTARLRGRLARELYVRLGKSSPELLGYGAKEVLAFARKFRADLTIVHSESGLWVGNRLLDDGLKVGVDFEDWFSEDLPPEGRAGRPIASLRRLEERLVRECRYRLTTSHAMAGALAAKFGVHPPTVVYNVFPVVEPRKAGANDRPDHELLSLHWYSQTIGPGRGLETLMKALPFLTLSVQVHLRGDCPATTRSWLKTLVPQEWRRRIFIHGTVPNDELPSRIAEHDIGLALELPYCASRRYTITNKCFQYLEAGLCVVASDTEGQREVISQCPGAGFLFPPEDAKSLAGIVSELAADKCRLTAAKNARREAVPTLFSWEAARQTIAAAADYALSRETI